MKITEFCTGCRMCERLCPKNCISMYENEEGFLEPKIKKEKCIECNVCKKRCPQNNNLLLEGEQRVFAMRIKDDEIIMKSASGGAFAALALYVLKNNGIVFGAAYNDKLEVEHISINNIKELPKLQSSKYVQSNTLNTYKECKDYLSEEKIVLYSGTPCQIAGLKSYLGKEYENLFTVDLICHGVPSPKLFGKYINWLSIEMGEKILSYNFRDKEEKGWGLEYRTTTRTKTRTRAANFDPYYNAFLKCATYRECCYSCKYSTRKRVGDITIGDYWGIEKEHPKFFDKKGVSVIILNSKNGDEIFEKIKDNIVCIESDINKAASGNKNLNCPSARHKLRNTVYVKINIKDDKEYIEKYLGYSLSLKDVIKLIIPKEVKMFIKSILNTYFINRNVR